MHHYQHLAAAFIATVVGVTFPTNAQAQVGQSAHPAGATSVLPAPASDDHRQTSRYVINVRPGTTIRVPAGTRLWPAAPVVISDVRASDVKKNDENVARY